MVRQPRAFLMDEPLSNLDAKLRVHMRSELADLHRRLGATFVYVTHDQVEAMTMSDRIAMMDAGRILQLGTPSELYERPANVKVASFIGSPAINLLPGRVIDGGAVQLFGQLLPSTVDLPAGSLVTVGVRPEAISLAGSGPPGEACAVSATLLRKENLGPEFILHAEVGDARIPVVARVASAPAMPAVDEAVALLISRTACHFFDPHGERIEAQPAPGRAPSSQLRASAVGERV
jgi:multiple sugar transport system ATP-binding protein